MKIRSKTFVLLVVTLLFMGAVGAVIYKTIGSKFQVQSQKKVVDPIPNNLTEENIAELSKVFDKINNSKNLYLEGSFNLTDNSTGKLIEQEPFILAKHQEGTYVMTGYVEQISSGNNVAILNNETKTIVSESVKKEVSKNGLPSMEALLNFKKYLSEFDSSKVFIQNKGKNKIIRIIIDNPQSLYRETEIEYDAINLQLVKSSVVTSIIDNTNNEGAEKKVLLTLNITTYNEEQNNPRPEQLNTKIRWKKNKLIVTDSLNSYSINHTINK